MRLRLVVLAVIAVAVPAMAKEKPGNPDDPNRKVCRKEVATGSVLSKRTCRTAEEWRVIDEKNAADLNTFHIKQGLSTVPR